MTIVGTDSLTDLREDSRCYTAKMIAKISVTVEASALSGGSQSLVRGTHNPAFQVRVPIRLLRLEFCECINEEIESL